MAQHLGSLIIENDLTVRDILKLAKFTTPGQYLTVVDAEGTIDVVDSPALNRLKIPLANYSTGSVAGDWNAQTPTLDVGPLDLIIVTWVVDSTDHIFMGSDGTYGAGGTDTATETDFYQLAGAGADSEFIDSVFRILNSGDLTKKIAFSGAAIAPNQTRTITMPDHDVDLGDLPEPPLTGNGNPNSTVNPRYTGDIFVDTTNLNIWSATSTSNLSWKRLDNVKTSIDVIAPTVNDDADAGYEVFSLWLDSVLNLLYICTDNTAGAAVWAVTGGGSGGGDTTQDITASVDVGGIEVDDVIPEGTSLTTFVDELIAPLVEPTKIDNYMTLSGVTPSIREIGENFSSSLSTGYFFGTIESKNGSADVPLTGVTTGTTFYGNGIDSIAGTISTPVLEGDNMWNVVVSFGQETAAYYDSKGDASTLYDSLRGPGSFADNSEIIDGKYKYWWDTIVTPDDSTAIRALPVSQYGWNEDTAFGIVVNNEVNDIAAYIKDGYTSIVITHDENGDLDITELFSITSITVNDGGGNPIAYSKFATNPDTFAGFLGVQNFTVTLIV